MSIAKGSYGRIIYVAESTWGTTPSSPSCTKIQFASETLAGEKSTLTSALLRDDRNIQYMIYGNKNAGGAINTELLYGAYDDFLAAALFGDWNTNVLKNGTTEKFFTIEKGLTDISKYIVYTGMMCSGFELDVTPNQIVTINFNFSGKNEGVPSSTSIDATAAYGTGVGSAPFDSFTGSLYEGGSSTTLITSIKFTLDNKFEDGYAIGSAAKAGIFAGRCHVTGTFSCYLEDLSIYTKFANGTESSIELTLTDADDNDYVITLPRVKFGGESPKISGEGPVIQNVPFTALYDSTQASTIKITRVPHA